jgi:hypothetical protein
LEKGRFFTLSSVAEVLVRRKSIGGCFACALED